MNDQSMRGKRVVLTGATAGIGEAAAEALAGMGCDLTFVARSREKAEALALRLRSLGQGTITYELGDLGELRDVRRVAEALLANATPIDVLINNAGAVSTKRETTSDGFERTFALNHLSYYALTHLLLDRVKASKQGRIVNTASDAHLMIGDMYWDDLQLAKRWPRRGWDAYCQSKLGNVMLTFALARRLAGSNVRINAVHPGFVRTELGKNNGLFAKLIVPVVGLFGARGPKKGADTIVWLATAPEAISMQGQYLYDRKPHRTSRAARDEAKQERLYALSAELVGIKVD
jgi:NAD(P)-dependent dehydrogenase (short-subunit alcohol dehydrogenase family)